MVDVGAKQSAELKAALLRLENSLTLQIDGLQTRMRRWAVALIAINVIGAIAALVT